MFFIFVFDYHTKFVHIFLMSSNINYLNIKKFHLYNKNIFLNEEINIFYFPLKNIDIQVKKGLYVTKHVSNI